MTQQNVPKSRTCLQLPQALRLSGRVQQSRTRRRRRVHRWLSEKEEGEDDDDDDERDVTQQQQGQIESSHAVAMEVEESDQTVGDYFSRPSSTQRNDFFKFHPQQDSINPVVQRLFVRTDGTTWKWLSFCGQRHALFCFVCCF